MLENFGGGNLITSLSPWAEEPCGALSVSNYRFPWNRVFEIGMDFHRETAAPQS